MPDRLNIHKRKFREFVRTFLATNVDFKPLPSDTDYTVESWLDQTKYGRARKIELLRARKEKLTEWDYRCKSFIKSEFLADFKEARIINSRSDAFKVLTGPYFHCIEHQIFKSKYFVKQIPVADRMKFIKSRLDVPNHLFAVTDFSSFEANITKELMEMCEFQLYSHMLRNAPRRKEVLTHIKRALSNSQTLVSRFGKVTSPASRMSGDMCTSLGNGFTNLMVNFYMFSQWGLEVDGVFEGDDGVLSFSRQGNYPKEADYANFGCKLKLKIVRNLGDAEFCGMFADESVGDLIGDPVWIMSTVGWSNSMQKAGSQRICYELLKAKAYSLVHELPRCPIVRSFANYLLRLTAKFSPRFSTNKYGELDWWTSQVMEHAGKSAPSSTIHPKSRSFMARTFGISEDTQHKYETYFDNCDVDVDIPAVGIVIPECFSMNWQMNVREAPASYRDVLVRW